MNELLSIDKTVLDKERETKKLPYPENFEKGRITPEDISKLLPLLKIPFDESAVIKREHAGFTSIGVPFSLQQARLYEVFGVDHIRFSHEIVEKEMVPSKSDTKDMHYYKVYVKLSIGNQTIYTDKEQTPKSTFVEYYYVEGIGFDGHHNKGIAEKKALSNGKKECLKTMGMLEYLYIESDMSSRSEEDNFLESCIDDESITYPTAKITLLEKPTIMDQGKIFLRCMATDNIINKPIEVIIYRENPMYVESHQSMIDTLKKHKNYLVRGKELHVEYKEQNYAGKQQYIISKVFLKDMKKGNE